MALERPCGEAVRGCHPRRRLGIADPVARGYGHEGPVARSPGPVGFDRRFRLSTRRDPGAGTVLTTAQSVRSAGRAPHHRGRTAILCVCSTAPRTRRPGGPARGTARGTCPTLIALGSCSAVLHPGRPPGSRHTTRESKHPGVLRGLRRRSLWSSSADSGARATRRTRRVKADTPSGVTQFPGQPPAPPHAGRSVRGPRLLTEPQSKFGRASLHVSRETDLHCAHPVTGVPADRSAVGGVPRTPESEVCVRGADRRTAAGTSPTSREFTGSYPY